jgi:hypothetical protein
VAFDCPEQARVGIPFVPDQVVDHGKHGGTLHPPGLVR